MQPAVALAPAGVPGSPWTCADWATYQAADFGFAFSYPQLWGKAGDEPCGPQGGQDGVHVGSRIEVALAPAQAMPLAEWVREFLNQRMLEPGGDWRTESVDSGLLGGVEALTVTYRFGGVRRLGMAILAERGAWRYSVGFTADGDACDLPTAGLTELAIYHHLLASFRFLSSDCRYRKRPKDTRHCPVQTQLLRSAGGAAGR